MAAAPTPALVPRESRESRAVVDRYEDAYRVARIIDWMGWAIKALGIVLASLVLCGAMYVYMSTTPPYATNQVTMIQGVPGIQQWGRGLTIILVIITICIGLGGYISGMLVSAVGQLLKSSLDSAVNSSPFLSNVQRAQAMSLH